MVTSTPLGYERSSTPMMMEISPLPMISPLEPATAVTEAVMESEPVVAVSLLMCKMSHNLHSEDAKTR